MKRIILFIILLMSAKSYSQTDSVKEMTSGTSVRFIYVHGTSIDTTLWKRYEVAMYSTGDTTTATGTFARAVMIFDLTNITGTINAANFKFYNQTMTSSVTQEAGFHLYYLPIDTPITATEAHLRGYQTAGKMNTDSSTGTTLNQQYSVPINSTGLTILNQRRGKHIAIMILHTYDKYGGGASAAWRGRGFSSTASKLPLLELIQIREDTVVSFSSGSGDSSGYVSNTIAGTMSPTMWDSLRAGDGTLAWDNTSAGLAVTGAVANTIYRPFLSFNTSWLGSNTVVDSAWLVLNAITVTNADTVYIDGNNGGLPYDAADYTSILGSNYGKYYVSATGNTEYKLNADGLANINTSGVSKFSLLSSWDKNNKYPGSDQKASINFNALFSQYGYPKLKVAYHTSASTTTTKVSKAAQIMMMSSP